MLSYDSLLLNIIDILSLIIKSLPDALVQMIRKFASELESWLQTALEDLPDNLRAIKIDCESKTITRNTL